MRDLLLGILATLVGVAAITIATRVTAPAMTCRPMGQLGAKFQGKTLVTMSPVQLCWPTP